MNAFRSLAAGCAFAAGLAASAAMAAETNFVGEWTGTSSSVVIGAGTHFSDSTGTAEAPFLSEKAFVLEIIGQKGQRVWGKLKSADFAEPIVFVVSNDGKQIHGANSDGVFSGTVVDADTIDLIYTQPGSDPTHITVAGETTYKRKK